MEILPASIQALQDAEDQQKAHDDFLFQAEEGVADLEISEDVLAELDETSEVKKAGHFKTLKSRNLLAVDAIQQELDQQKAVAKFEEVKFTTEAEMDALLKG